MIASLKNARAHEFLGDKPLEKKISRAGRNLSGGQRQRLAMARALTRDASVYLFDDSFSALDYKTDYELRQLLKKSLEDKIVIVVAQRVATILNADKILVLEDCRMAGYGNHQDLMKTNEVYRKSQLVRGKLMKKNNNTLLRIISYLKAYKFFLFLAIFLTIGSSIFEIFLQNSWGISQREF